MRLKMKDFVSIELNLLLMTTYFSVSHCSLHVMVRSLSFMSVKSITGFPIYFFHVQEPPLREAQKDAEERASVQGGVNPPPT